MRQIICIMVAFTAGLYFATCQVGYFIHMEFNLSSTFVSYYVVIGLWILGSLVGLFIKLRKLSPLLILGGLTTFFLHSYMLHKYPYNMQMLPLYMLFIFSSALYSGYYFRWARRDFKSVKSLFFHENNGFLFGYVIAVGELLLHGQLSQYILPPAAATVHLILLFVANNRLTE
ncbi:MAG: hypothetical protein GY775_18430 [Candidatus Scalindua sp.]|nr:hypothetical protein [Candidatus Scalindua sp.]